MNEVKHTKGPWKIVLQHLTYGPANVIYPEGDDGPVIARVATWHDTREDRDATIAEATANARLIAAAPDLLKALIEVMSALDAATQDFEYPDAKKTGTAAIAKALHK